MVAGMFIQANAALAGPKVPTPGACTIKALSVDWVSKSGTTGYSYDINKYGGDGCEVMLDVNAQLFVGKGQSPISGWEVGGSYSYNHQVKLEAPLPDGVAMPAKVPIKSLLQIEGHISGGSGYFFDVSSVVNGQGLGYTFIEEASFSYSKAVSSLVSPNTNFVASVRGWAALGANVGQTTTVQLIVDPFVVVDPSFAYADYFGVYQKKSDGTWVELHRDWMQPVPEPAIWVLMAAGLGLLGAMKERRDRTRARKARYAR